MAKRKADRFATEKGTVNYKAKQVREEKQRKMCSALDMGYDQSSGRCKKKG